MTERQPPDGTPGRKAVGRVRRALMDAGYGDRIRELDETARSARDAATAINTALGSIVKSLVFSIDGQLVMALIAGDRRCEPQALARALNLAGEVKKADADTIKNHTGFSIGGVAPVGSVNPVPVVIDHSLTRFDTVYAAAGHPHCVFPASVDDLKRLTGGCVSPDIAIPL